MAEITLVKGETSALDRTWMSMPDGSTRQVAVRITGSGSATCSGGSTTKPSPRPSPAPGN